MNKVGRAVCGLRFADARRMTAARGGYVPRSVDWHPALWCIISLIQRNTDGNQVAPLTREHPRRRYTPVDYPGAKLADSKKPPQTMSLG